MRKMVGVVLALVLTGNIAWAADNYTGKFTNKSGELSCKMVPGNKIKFLIFTSVGMQSCILGKYESVFANLTDERHASYKGDGKCTIDLSFDKGKVTVKTRNCDSAYCGISAAGSMDGVYMKKSDTPEFYGTGG